MKSCCQSLACSPSGADRLQAGPSAGTLLQQRMNKDLPSAGGQVAGRGAWENVRMAVPVGIIGGPMAKLRRSSRLLREKREQLFTGPFLGQGRAASDSYSVMGMFSSRSA